MASPRYATPPLQLELVEAEDISGAFAASTQIGAGTDIGSVSANVGGVDDPGDLFFFQSSGEALTTVTATVSVTSGAAELAFYNLAGELLAFSTNPGSSEDSLEYTLGLDGGLFAYVYSDGTGPATYDLSLRYADAGEGDFLGGAPAPRSDFPDGVAGWLGEPDPDWEWTIYDGAGTVGGASDPRDLLRYAYGGATPGNIYLNMGSRGGDSVVSILDAAGDTVARRYLVEGAFHEAWFNAQAVEDYYFQVESAIDGVAIDWSIDAVLPGSGFTPTDTVEGVDLLDVGNDFSSAYAWTYRDSWAAGASDVPGIEAAVGFDGDVTDTFSLSVPFDGALSLGVRYTDYALELVVYDQAGTRVAVGSGPEGSAIAGLQFPVSAGEDYFLQVYNASLPTYYGLDAFFEAAGSSEEPPAGTEDEVRNRDDGDDWQSIGDAGDGLFTAHFLPANSIGSQILQGTLGARDDGASSIDTRDIYRFEATATGRSTIVFQLHEDDLLNPQDAAPVRFRLLDGGGRTIAVDEDARSGTLFAELNAGETYYIEFEQVVPIGLARYYAIVSRPVPVSPGETLSFGADTSVFADAGDTFNAAFSLSFAPGTGDAYVRGWVDSDLDEADYYRVQADVSGGAWFKLNGLAADLSLSVLDADGALLYESDNADDNAESIFGSVEAGETYYIGVKTSLGMASPYSLSLGFNVDDEPGTAESRINGPAPLTAAASANSVPQEFSASVAADDSVNGVPIGDAGDLGLPVALDLDALGDAFASGNAGVDAGNGPDTDVFFVTSPVSGWAEVALYGLSDNLNLNIYGETDFRGRGLEPGTLAETVRFPVMRGGSYFIEVLSADNGASDYELFVDFALQEADYLLIDPNDDGLFYDADILTDDGLLLSAFALQTFRTYAGSLNRTPDTGGFAWWLEQRELGNHTLDSMAAGFNFAREFLGNFPGAEHPDDISSGDFINYMYNNVFGRPADAGGFEFYTSLIDSGERSQARVIVEMTQSNEYVLQTALSAIGFLEDFLYPLGT